MKIVVLENEAKWQKDVKDIILRLSFNRYDIKLKQFTKSNKEMIDEIKDRSEPKIYILDIELESKISGLAIAKKIREEDWESHIIFLTSHGSMFADVYKEVYEVFTFIEKYHNMDIRLEKALTEILSRKNDNRLFEYHTRNIDLQIYYRDILYIERDTNDRKLIIHTERNTFSIRMNITELVEILGQNFKQVHRACIVNKEHVSKYDWSKGIIYFDNATSVALLSKKYKEVVLDESQLI